MRTTYAFLKKEWMEYARNGKLLIVGLLFLLFGIMNPAIAKLMPALMEMVASSDESGMIITLTEVDASTSWMQFYKNIDMALIVCILLFGGIMTNELQKGTLIPVLTKGLSRWKVPFSKGINLFLIWTAGYFLCYYVTYFYTGYYWDNSIMTHLLLGAVCYWLYGMFMMALIIFFSALASSFGGVVLGVGGCYFIMMLISLAPKVARYLPNYLANSSALTTGGTPKDFVPAIIVTTTLCVVSLAAGCVIFNKKEI